MMEGEGIGGRVKAWGGKEGTGTRTWTRHANGKLPSKFAQAQLTSKQIPGRKKAAHVSSLIGLNSAISFQIWWVIKPAGVAQEELDPGKLLENERGHRDHTSRPMSQRGLSLS